MEKRQQHESVVNDTIARQMEALFPLGAGQASSGRVEHALRQVAERAFQVGGSYALLSLLTVEDVAGILHVSPRRVRALARQRHTRFGVGWQVPGTSQWLFRPEEIEQLRPDERYRRK